MAAALKPFRLLLFAAAIGGLGCHAQVPPAATAAKLTSDTLSPELARRVEVLIRQKTNVSPEYRMLISPKVKSIVPSFDEIQVTFTDGDNTSRPIAFLLSKDGKTLAQMNTYDISQDPRTLVSAADRPARGGPVNAPVTIVLFDDLECPYCAREHAQLFPALLNRYKDQVRIVYRDFPLEQHPWAMHAAIDSNCLAAETPAGYWNLVDYIHLHAAELGKSGDGVDPKQALAKVDGTLDTLTLDEGKRQKVDETKLAACVKKQDAEPIRASMQAAEKLGVGATPAVFVNGEKLEGALPLEWLYRTIDGALTAEGVTPPPPAAPAVPAASAGNTAGAASAAGSKSGNDK